MSAIIPQQIHDIFNVLLVLIAQHKLSVAILIAAIISFIPLWCGCIPFWRIRKATQSSVWLALSIIPPKIVVWKRVNLRFSKDGISESQRRRLKEDTLKRFLEREILILIRIKEERLYNFVVKLISARRKSYAMEYLPKNLAKWLVRFSKSNPSWEQALAVFLCIGLQICKGLQALYNCGVEAHRDLKPGNVMVVKITLSPKVKVHVKIIDMGTVRMPDGAVLTAEGTTLQNKFYGAPECWRDVSSADNRADVFSLCVILWRLITYFAKVEQDYENKIFDKYWNPENATYNLVGFCDYLKDTLDRALPVYSSSQSGSKIEEITQKLQDVLGRGLNIKRPTFDELQRELQSIYNEICEKTNLKISEPLQKDLQFRSSPVLQDETQDMSPIGGESNGRRTKEAIS